jgi:arylsulfatase A-like enzyme
MNLRRIALLGLVVCCLLGCRPGTETATARGASVVLISIDTLRSDRLPAYGYERIESPALTALAGDAVLFERAYSHCPLTLPSHASLFTGLLPPQHGVRDNKGFQLGDAHVTLAEILGDAGYRCAAFVSSAVLRRSTGIGQGFEPYDDDLAEMSAPRSRAFAQRRGDRTVDAARRWLDSVDPAEPFFLFVHLFDPHSPYDAPEPWASRHEDPYDAEIAYTDQIVGELLSALRARGLYDSTLVVLLSDHGEGLGDHGEREHGLLLYREALQVPLMIKLPGNRLAGRRIDTSAGLYDIAPTIRALLGIETAELPGQTLLGGVPPAAERPLYAESLFSRFQYGWSETRSIIRDALHYIDAPRPELYDLRQDPHEQRDLLATRDLPAAMLAALDDIGNGAEARAEISAEERRLLASLGYVGTTRAVEAETLPIDPKDRVRDAEELWFFAWGEVEPGRRYTDAQLFQLLDSIGPANEYLHRAVAGELLHQRRIDSAFRVLRRFEDSDDPETRVLLGKTLVELGRMDEAREQFDRARTLDERHAEAYFGLATVLMTSGRFDEARPLVERSLELDAELPEAWNGLGVVRLKTGDPRGALEAWVRSVELDPELEDAWFNLVIARRELGDAAGAAEALRRLIPLLDGEDKRSAQAMLSRLEDES